MTTPAPTFADVMTRMSLPDLMRWEDAAAPGTPVQAYWTNSNRDYTAPAIIERVNRASIRVSLTAEVCDPANANRVAYPSGWSIAVPRAASGRWTWANCCLPAAESTPATTP